MMLSLTAHLLHSQGGRSYQEDAWGYHVRQDVACLVVADGAGGHGGGDLASQLVVRAILEQHAMQPQCSMEAAAALIQHAQQVVLAGQRRFAQYTDMRSTVVMALVDLATGQAVFGNVGDSRAYWFHDATVLLQTRDHSLVQQMVDAGMIGSDQIRSRKERSVLTSSLGSPGALEPYVYELGRPASAGDVLLLCTDGLWEYVHEDEMQQVLRLDQDGDRHLACFEQRVQQRAPRHCDNFTGLMAVFHRDDAATGQALDPESTVIAPLDPLGRGPA